MKLTWTTIQNFAFKVHVQAFVRKANCEKGSLQKLATSIYDRYLKNKNLDITLQAYLDLCWTIDGVKTGAIGLNGPISRSNMLMQAIAMIFAREANFTASETSTIESLENTAKTGSFQETWFYPKLHALATYARYATLADGIASGMALDPKLGEMSLEFIREATKEAGAQVTDMMRELVAMRKYGVKNSFFQDGMFHQPDQAWVFMDFHDVLQEVPEWKEFLPNTTVALTSLTDKSSLQQIWIQPNREKVGKAEMTGVHTTFTTRGLMFFDSNGELDTTYGLGLMPIRHFFARHGKEHFYEILRFAQAIRLYDLVVPLTTVAKMPQPLVPNGTLDRLKSVFSKRHLLHPDLIIPRMRALENTDLLIRELEIEIEQAETETANRTKRELRKHEVICHVRKLPEGKHATPAARALAAEYDIVLADNETFVKKHNRGSKEANPLPHRAVARR